MRFRKLLFAGLGALVVLVATMAATGIVALHFVSSNEGALATQYADDLALVQRVRHVADQLVETSRGYLLGGEDALRGQFSASRRELDHALSELARLRLDPRSGQEADAVHRAVHAYVEAAARAIEQRSTLRDPTQIVPVFDNTLVPLQAELEADLARLAVRQRTAFETSLRSAQALAGRAQFVLVLSSILAISCGIALALVVSRRLSGQFREVEAATALATRAAAAREEILAVVSHDLRNPLQAIMMSTTLVHDTTREEVTRRYALTMTNAAQRMKHMIDELLEASQIENDKVVLCCEPIEARDLVDAAVELFHARADERSVTLSCEVSLGRIVADRERVIEVLSNLFGNALKFTPRGGHIAVRADLAGDMGRFSIADDGPGIAADKVSHLFERYWQGDQRKGREGLGLGLYICKRLVEAHHGAIGVESAVGKGTTFWFTVPAIVEARRAS
jgi:signal transduction histidine kinase